MPGSGSQFYTVKEVAQILGVSYATAYDYVSKKLRSGNNPLPVVRLGKHIIRIPKDKFNKWAGLA